MFHTLEYFYSAIDFCLSRGLSSNGVRKVSDGDRKVSDSVRRVSYGVRKV